jgi:hypothetical protein
MCSVLRFEQVILYVKYYIFGARSSSSGGRLLYNIIYNYKDKWDSYARLD